MAKPGKRRSMSGNKDGGVFIRAGQECTINRAGNHYYDQLQYSGHYHRITEDMEQLEGPASARCGSPCFGSAVSRSETTCRLTGQIQQKPSMRCAHEK